MDFWSRPSLSTLFIVVVLTISIGHLADGTRKSKASVCLKKYKRIKGHTACLKKSQFATKSGVSSADKKLIVDLHNKLRGKVDPPATNMQELVWDDEVAMMAQKWADTCAETHESENQLRAIPGRFRLGQNLAFGQKNWASAIEAWFREVSDFKYGSDSNVLSKVGHYTQVVWAETKAVGCGYAYCTDVKKSLFFCDYAPSGNKGGLTKPYIKGVSASACPKFKKGNLCACSEACENDGKHDLSTCECSCVDMQPFTYGPKCAMDCEMAKTKQNAQCKDNSKCAKFGNYQSMCPILCNVCPLDVFVYEHVTENPSESMETTTSSTEKLTSTVGAVTFCAVLNTYAAIFSSKTD